MAENIFKLYSPPNRIVNPKKSQGLWHNEPDSIRYEHVNNALHRYCDTGFDCDYDYLDLVWHIKNAVVGDIFMSDGVYQGYLKGNYWRGATGKKKAIIDRIASHDTRIQGCAQLDESLLEVRKWLSKSNHTNSFGNMLLLFEHVIPAKVYIEELIDAYNNKRFTLSYFVKFRTQINVCIVTDTENNKLNKYRQRMPSGWSWGANPLQRYLNAGIKIH